MLFQEFLKSAIDERERSVEELLRVRRLVRAQPRDVRWRSGTRLVPRHRNRQRGL
jgi:hypothetical protein